MNHIELPDSIYRELLAAARAAGASPSEWIQRHLPKNAQLGNHAWAATDDEITAADARLDQWIVSRGCATGLDNESIDADLARAYGDKHEPVIPPQVDH